MANKISLDDFNGSLTKISMAKQYSSNLESHDTKALFYEVFINGQGNVYYDFTVGHNNERKSFDNLVDAIRYYNSIDIA